jgi:hypothetical protein
MPEDIIKKLQRIAKENPNKANQQATSLKGKTDYSGLGAGEGKFGTKAIPKYYEKIGSKLGWNPFSLPEDMEKEAYLNQGGGEVLANTIAGFGTQALAGVIDSVAAYDMKGLYDMSVGNTEQQYGNWLNEIGKNIREYSDENFQIYQDGDSMWNTSYWAKQAQSLGYTGGIIAETIAEQVALAYLTGGTGNELGLASKARLMKTAGQGMFGMFKGIQEGYMNALETQSNVYQKYKELGYDEAEAQKKANEAATLGFRAEVGPLAALNALQFMTTFGVAKSAFSRGAGPNLGFSGGVETLIDRALPSITNKYGKAAVGFGVNALSEGVEEGIQTGVSKYAQHKTLKSTGNASGDLDIWDKEMRDSIIGGVFGGGLFAGAGKLLNKYTQGTAAKQYSKAHDSFLSDAVSRTSNTFENQQKVQQEYNEASKAYNENKSKANLSRLERASQMVKEAQYNSHLTNTVNALQLDYVNGKTTAFETHIEQMQTLLDAANEGDIETLKKYNILGQDNKEKFEGAIDTIKNTFEQNIKDSHLIKEKLENNLLNVTSDFESAFDITKKEYLNTKKLDNVSEYATALNTMYSKDTQFNQLSSEGKRRFQLEAELESFNRLDKLSDLDLQRKQEIQTELEGLEDYKANDKRVVDSINKMPYVSAYVSIASTNQSIEDTNTELSKLRDINNIREKVKERIKKKVEKAKSKEEVQEVVQDAQEQGISTPKLEQQIEQREREIELNLPPQNRVEENISTPTENTENVLNELEEPTSTTQSEIKAKKADVEKLEKEKQEALQPLIEEKERLEKEIAEIEKGDKEQKGSVNEVVSISLKEAEKLTKYLSKKYGILSILTDLLPEFTYGKFTTEKILINKNTYYDKNGEITFEPKGFVNKITIYHEYLHPFVQIIERYNPELYEKIYQESLNSDIDVSHYIKDVRKEERIVRYLDKLSAQEKVPSLLQQFFDFLSDLFYRNKKSNYKTIQKLNKNTTINELFAIFKNYGALSEEAKGIKEERFLKLEKTQLENLIRLNAGDIENHKKELEIIIQKLHTLERYDVNNLDQLKQQLAEVNKKIDEVTKRFDAQIAQKQSELKALEQQPTSAKKADIEIGKVGNTEYEVKVDGVYYQGKKLNNPENKTHKQLIEADIERRRQEELEYWQAEDRQKRIKDGRETTKKVLENLKKKYPATTFQGIAIRLLEKIIDFNTFAIINSEGLRLPGGQDATKFGALATGEGMAMRQDRIDALLAGDVNAVKTFIHELVHTFTKEKVGEYQMEKSGLIPGYKAKLTEKEKQAVAELERIYNKVKAQFPSSTEYGLTNLDEFLAEAFSNDSFQGTLKEIKAEGKKTSLFKEWLNAVVDLFYAGLEKWAKRFNKEIPNKSEVSGILEDVMAWTEDLIDNKLIKLEVTTEEINAKYDAELKAVEQPTSTTETEITEDDFIPTTMEDWEFPEAFQSRYNENSKVDISDKAVEAGRNELNDLRDKLNRQPIFEDFINSFIEKYGKERIEKSFNKLSFLANKLGLDTSLANEYYDRTFNNKQIILDELGFDEEINETVVEPQQVEQQEKEATKVVAQINPVDITVNTTTGEVKANTVVFNDENEEGYDESEIGELGSTKIATGITKFAFNPTSEKSADGKWNVNLNNLSNSILGKDGLLVLDSDYMHQVAKNSVEKPGSVYIEFTDDSKIINAIPGLKEKLNKAKTEEEKAMLRPILVIHETTDKDGKSEFKAITFVHSYGWYTDENTADEATKIQGNENVKQLRLSLAKNPKKRQAIQVYTPRGVQFNSTNKHGNKELLPVSTRNKQSTVGYAKHTRGRFQYMNVPEDLQIDLGNEKSEDRDRIINIDTFESSDNAFYKNNPVIFHKVGVNKQGQNLYMINTSLSPYTYNPRNEREKNLGNAKLPEDLKRTFEKALLGILLKSKKLNPKLKEAIDKLMPLSEQQNKNIQSLSSLNMLAKFIRVFQPGHSSYSYKGDKNTSVGFREELNKYKKEGKRCTIFREFKNPETGIENSEMAFWDEIRQDYRIIDLQTFSTGTLVDTEIDTKHLPEDFDILLNQMIQAMSVVNIYATSPNTKTNLITNEGIKTVPTEEIYKDLLLTPLVSYEMENAKGETIEVFNIQPVIHFTPIEANGDIKDVSQDNIKQNNEKQLKTTLEKANQAAQEISQEIENEQVNSQIQLLKSKKEAFINGLIDRGYTEEKALQMFNTQLKLMGEKSDVEFESRNNIDTVEVLKNENTLKIEGISIEEQKHLISYLKHSVLGSDTLKKIFNKNKLTLEAKQEIVNNIENSLNSVENIKTELKNSEEILESLNIIPSENNLNLILKYEKILENKNKIKQILKQEIEDLDIDIESIDSLSEEEISFEDTNESFDKTNGEQNTKMQFGFSLKASLYGIQKENKSGQQLTGLLELPIYYSPDEVYDKMMEVIISTSNNLDMWKKAFNSKYESSKVNGKTTHNTTIYKNILNYLNSLPEERINELMTILGSQAKLIILKQNVSISQFSKSLPDGTSKSYKTWVDVQILDENSSKQEGVIKRNLISNFTNSVFGTFAQIKDGDVVVNKEYLTNIISKLNSLVLLPDTNSKKYDFKTLREIFDLLGFYGINDNTIQYIINTKNSQGNINLYGEKILFKPLLENLKNILNSKEAFSLFGTYEKSPYRNLEGLNTLIKKEVEINGSAIASAIRVSEKTLQGTLQGTAAYDIAKTFLNETEREKALKEFGQDLYTKDNILIEVIAKSQKFRENFELAFNSPEVMKIHGKNVFGNSDIDEISNSDRLAFYFNMFVNTKGEILLEDKLQKTLNEKYVDDTSNKKLKFKVARVPSLSLSDKGRILLIPSVLVGLEKEDLSIIDGNLESLDSSVLNYVYNSVFKGELNRIIEVYKTNKGSNFKEYSKGSRIFSSLASLNGIKINYTPIGATTSEETNIHKVIAIELRNNNKEIRPEVLEQIEDAIKEKFENYVKSELNNKLREVERINNDEGTVVNYEGEFVKSGIIQDTITYKDNKIVSLTFTDKNGKTSTETKLSMVNLSEIKEKPGNNQVEKLQHSTVEFIINNFVTNLTNTGVFLKDPAFYHKSKIGLKLEKAEDILIFDDKTLEQFNNPAKLIQLQKDIASNIQKRSALMIAPGYNLTDSVNTPLGESRYATEMIHIAVQDVEIHSMMLEGMIRNHYGKNLTEQQEQSLGELKKINNTIEKYKSQLENYTDVDNIQNKINEINSLINDANQIGIIEVDKEINGKRVKIKEDIFQDLRPYFEITGTDAQEYSTWKTHLDTLYRKGKNNITKEQFKDLTHKFENGIDLTEEDLKLIFQPIKGVYTGSVFDNDTQKMRPVYIKSSVFPLLPQWVKGTPLDNVRKNLESLEQTRSNGYVDKQIRMSYQSANKIGSKNTKLSMQFLYNSTPEQFKNSKQLESAKSILPMTGWRIQQETPSKEEKYFLKGKDARITLGSQFFKGIMGNFINKIPRKSFNNLFSKDILKLAGIEITDKEKLTGEQLDKIYTKVYEKYSNIQLEQLEKELDLEAINNFYAPETTNEQKIVVLKSIQKLLKKEISRKGYPTYLKDSLDLINDELQYQSVLMFDNNRYKFEAMLQSIIANRLIIHTLPGNSHISASSEGFMKKKHLSELSTEDKSNIVWLNPEATGELKATYLKDNNGKDVFNDNGEKILIESEIAISSHFKYFNKETNQYEYVNLIDDKYSTEIKNDKGEITGRVLKQDMISEKMLSNFGFRIPTSSHQSGTILKVVAFLPRNVGDLVLVPKEQTTQLGEDYDVDKRYMYKANYIVDETGKVRELQPEDFELFKNQYLSKENKIELLQDELDKLKSTRKDLYNLLESDEVTDKLLESIFGQQYQEEINDVKKEIKDINSTLYLAKKINEKLKSEFEIKLLENGMINIYKSVYTSSDLEVQKKIYKPLITDVAEKSAKTIDNAVNTGEINENFSMFSDSYQRYLMQLGADGKGGIGVHSNGVVLLSQLQRLPSNKKIQLGWFTPSKVVKGGYIPAQFKSFEVLFNKSFIKNSFYGVLGKSKMTLDGKREVAEQPGENQNVSTDNINKGIMVLRNENSHTLDIYNMLALMGIDQSNDELVTIDGDIMYAHVPSFLVSQPIMKRYVELKEKYKKLDADFKTQEDINEEIQEELFLEFTGGYTSFNDYNDVLNSKQFNSQLLYDMIKDTNMAKSNVKIDKYSNGEVQWAIFKMLMDVKEQSDKINKVRKLANLSTSKLGISYFETIDKMNNLKELQEELEEANRALEDDEISSYNGWLNLLVEVQNGELIPTTIEGVQLLNSLEISKKLMPILFNYENANILNGGIIDKIFNIEEKDIASTSASTKKEKYQIMSEFTNFINSGMGVFNGNTFEEISRLTRSTESNKSLGFILQDLLQKRHPIMQNYLLKDLQISTDAKTGVSVIKHTAQDVGTLEDNNKINAFLDLLKDDTIVGNYNGENLTVANIAKDLISYSILADNQNGATGYRQFIPVAYLEATGFSRNVRGFNSRLQNEYLEEIQERFVQQYLQHNPDKIKYKDSIKGKPVIPEGGKIPKFALVRTSGSVKKIFKWNKSTKSYEEIPVLGSANNIDTIGINEYDFNNDVNKTVFQAQQPAQERVLYAGTVKANASLNELNYLGQVNRIFKTEEMLKGDANAIKALMDSLFANPNMDKLNPGYREIWDLYKNYLNKDVKIKFEIPEKYKNSARFEGVYNYSQNTIYVNPNIFTTIYDRLAESGQPVQVNTVFKEFRRFMMEEVLHSIQVAHLEKGLNTPQGKSIREYFQKALKLGIKNSALQDTGNEFVDIAEFIAGIYHDPTLRLELEKADKGFINRFLNAIKRFMQEMIPGQGFDKVHHDMMEMIKSNLGNVNFLGNQVQNEIKPVFKGKMTFGYGQEKRNDIKATSTFEAIKNGERIATTRYESDGHLNYWKKAKIGDIIEFESAKGEKVLVQVTKPLTKLSENTSAEEWSKKEGWSERYFNYKVKHRLNEAWQIEYKLYNPIQEVKSQLTPSEKLNEIRKNDVNNESNLPSSDSSGNDYASRKNELPDIHKCK